MFYQQKVLEKRRGGSLIHNYFTIVIHANRLLELYEGEFDTKITLAYSYEDIIRGRWLNFIREDRINQRDVFKNSVGGWGGREYLINLVLGGGGNLELILKKCTNKVYFLLGMTK